MFTETLYVPQPLQIRLNHWAGDMSFPGIKNWLGEIDYNEQASIVQYDWIKVMSLSDYFKNQKTIHNSTYCAL